LALFTLLLQFACIFQVAKAQSIDYSRPPESDSINSILESIPEGKEPGPKVGSRIGFFKLYGLGSDSLDIAMELGEGKPVFLINGSYTCPRFRKQVNFFDSLNQIYHNDISFFVIYCIEAHPHYPDPSPYTKELYISRNNTKEKIAFRQPKTYKERKSMASKMVEKTKLDIPVFIDTPDNKWLTTFGSMPNSAYLINSNGKIVSKYLDYEVYTKEIIRDLSSISVPKKK
jgi:hypothetical protein